MLRIIKVLDDGTVKLKRYDESGELEKKILSSKFDIFVQKYKITKNVRALLEGWPDNDASESDAIVATKIMSLVQFVITEHYYSEARPEVTIQEKPNHGLFVNGPHKAKAFKLSIYGKVSLDRDSKGVPAKTFEIKGITIDDKSLYVKPMSSKDDGVTAAAFIRWVEDEEEANSKIEWKPQEVTYKGKIKMQVPIITNKYQLKKGDEITLCRFWEVDKSHKIKSEVMLPGASNKRLKVS